VAVGFAPPEDEDRVGRPVVPEAPEVADGAEVLVLEPVKKSPFPIVLNDVQDDDEGTG